MSCPELLGRYVTVDETRIYYEAVGDSSDPPVVCLHTAGAEGRQWRYVAPQLAEAGYRVVVPDLPGHGKSYPVDWRVHTSIHEHAEFVVAFAAALGLERPAIAGCSIGGATALDVAVHHAPEISAAVVMEAAGRTRGAALGRFAHPHACPGWQSVLDYSVIDSTGDVGPVRREELKWQHRGAQAAATNDLQAWADHDVTDRLADATCPVLLVRGAADFFVQDDVFDRTVEGLPDVETAVLDGVGHYPMMEAPDRVSTLVSGFLDDSVR
ncbi:alpha/beta fold hydrolase [Halomarina halobia]|uniref:Alpha/beta fold hydrolase n=1 Tax=Halomarina halobia TaxID=3033386 RepID=A0ABD6ADV2_9EURY|nr:alpha/beta hydrolase [Halomarina sp. PSR21]